MKWVEESRQLLAGFHGGCRGAAVLASLHLQPQKPTRTHQAEGQGPPERCVVVSSLSAASRRCSLWGHSARAGLQSQPSQTHSTSLCCARTSMTHFLLRTRGEPVIQQHRCWVPAWRCAGSCPSRTGLLGATLEARGTRHSGS